MTAVNAVFRLRGRDGGIFAVEESLERTSFLLLEGQLGPVGLHAVTQSHPELGLLLEGHALPSLLDVGEGWVGDGVSRGSSRGQGGSAAHKALAQQVGGRCAQHGGRIYCNFGRREGEG